MKRRSIYWNQPAFVFILMLSATQGCKELQKLIQTNQAPVIDRITARQDHLAPLDTTSITVAAHDPEGGALSFAWTTNGGSLSATTGSRTRWQAASAAGDFKISIKVRDEQNAETEGAITLAVIASETPIVEIAAPPDGAFIPGVGVFTIRAAAHHPNGIARVEFYLGNTALGMDDTAPYEWLWRVEGLSGPATILVKAFRAQGAGEPGVDSVRVSLEGATRL